MTGIINRMLFAAVLSLPLTLAAKPKTVEARALETMKSATSFMMDRVSFNGGFVWYYLPDFSRQWGEMEAKRTMCWTQAPGTPQVWHLLLDAYHATGDEYYYEMAERVGNSLVWGRLECGGWPQRWPLMYDHVFRGMPDYSSFVTLNDDVIPDNIEFLIQYEALLSTPVEELTAGSPMKEKGLVPLDRYYTSVRVEEDPAVAISSLTPEGCWLSPLRNTSNPYRPGASSVPSTETKYCSTNAGDEYDTSPYRNGDPSLMCISTQDYINKMWALIKLIDK